MTQVIQLDGVAKRYDSAGRPALGPLTLSCLLYTSDAADE